MMVFCSIRLLVCLLVGGGGGVRAGGQKERKREAGAEDEGGGGGTIPLPVAFVFSLSAPLSPRASAHSVWLAHVRAHDKARKARPGLKKQATIPNVAASRVWRHVDYVTAHTSRVTAHVHYVEVPSHVP